MTRSDYAYNVLEKDITYNCSALKLPDKIVAEALSILRKYLKKKNLQGRNLEQYSASLIWLACKKWNYPLTAKSINDVLNLDSHKTKHHQYVTVKGELTIIRVGKVITRVIEENITSVSLDKYIEMIQGQIGAHPDGLTNAYMIMDYIQKNKIDVGHNNPALACAICYVANKMVGDRVIEKEYAKIVGTTEISLRSYKRKLLEQIPYLKKRGSRYYWKEFPIQSQKKSDLQDVQDEWWKSVTGNNV